MCEQSINLSLAITFGTTAYHIAMRLLVGLIFHFVMQNKADYRKQWYQASKLEVAVYEKLNIKKWKCRMPTYDHTLFDPYVHTWDEIAQVKQKYGIIERENYNKPKSENVKQPHCPPEKEAAIRDELRDDLWQHHPQVNIVDFEFYSMDIFNRCENTNDVLLHEKSCGGFFFLQKIHLT